MVAFREAFQTQTVSRKETPAPLSDWEKEWWQRDAESSSDKAKHSQSAQAHYPALRLYIIQSTLPTVLEEVMEEGEEEIMEKEEVGKGGGWGGGRVGGGVGCGWGGGGDEGGGGGRKGEET